MDQQSIVKTSIEGLLKIERPTHDDDRGFFREWLRISELEQELGFAFNIKQANHSSSQKNTLRGIHVAPWNKLIYIPKGEVQSVVVDLREGSPTFGKYESFMLGENDRSSIFIPKGCGNSYLVLSEEAEYIYLTDEEWSEGKEKGIAWNDPKIAIGWHLEGEPLISEKDQQNPKL